ncbi:epimerase family protein SDR39U1 [Clarias gariepinus]
MRVLIGGGSGFIGRELIRLLKVKGHEVTVISRHPGVGRITWADLESAGLPVCDAVVNLAGENILNPLRRWSESYRADVFNSRINTTRSLTHCITSSHTPPQSWVLITGLACYRPNGETQYTEDSEWTTFDLWSQLVKEWEEVGRLPGNATENTRQVVIRSGVVLGRGGGAIQQMLPPFWLGLGGTLGSGSQPFPWIHVSDLAGIIAHSLDPSCVPASPRPAVFNGVAPALNTNLEFTRELGQALRRPTPLPVPEFLLRAALGPERAAILTQGARVVPRRALESGFRFQYPDLTSALRQILSRSP